MRKHTTTILTILGSFSLAACAGNPPTDDSASDPEHPAAPPGVLAHGADDLPTPGSLTSPAEGYAEYDSSIDTVEMCGGLALRPGPQAFADYVRPFGIAATSYDMCQTGFHPRGQALDVFLDGHEAKQQFADWLTANDSEMARRLGLVQIIWNHQMWRSYNGGASRPQGEWGAYFGANPHTDHIHISFGEDGAQGATSYFRDVIGSVVPPRPSTSTWTDCGTLHVDQAIGTDRPLPSCSGAYFLAQQTDGNLVLYRTSGGALWSSGTAGTIGNLTIMQSDGNLVLYTPNFNALFATGTAGFDGAELAVQDDGNLVIYFGGVAIWNSGTFE